ncbi:hypothetical protein PT974_03416 [Cladobotryum mycophilum]|uniref:ABC-type glycine betaine transport system substrate-binding domain-containing protein n=1 Tax=Cladobotryum mycophilum TaxID=491253 RepID=A0ABR0SSD2_9HYPO
MTMTSIRLGLIEATNCHNLAHELVLAVLRRLGYEPQTIPGTANVIASKLYGGEVDITIASMDEPSHSAYVKSRDHSPLIIFDNILYKHLFFWGVPDYVPEVAVGSIEDLLKTETRDLMLSNICQLHAGTDVGAQSTMDIMKKYELNAAGYKIIKIQDEFLDDAYRNNKWFVTPTWYPCGLYHRYKIRPLEDPKGLLYNLTKAMLMIPKSSRSKFTEEALSILKRITIGHDALSALDDDAQRNNTPPRLAVLHWMRTNKLQVDSWFTKTPYERLDKMGFKITPAPPVVGNCMPFRMTRHGLIETSLQPPFMGGGLSSEIMTINASEKGSDNTSSVAYGLGVLAIGCALNILSQLHDASKGNLSRVRMIRLEYHIMKDLDLDSSTEVVDTASEMIKATLSENGEHARTVIHHSHNPLDQAVLLAAHAELLW